MRGISIAYVFLLGWYARASGLDADAWDLLCEGYGRLARHTADLIETRHPAAVDGARDTERVSA